MAKIKTTETLKSVDEFINAVADETKRNDSFRIIEILKKQTVVLSIPLLKTSFISYALVRIENSLNNNEKI